MSTNEKGHFAARARIARIDKRIAGGSLSQSTLKRLKSTRAKLRRIIGEDVAITDLPAVESAAEGRILVRRRRRRQLRQSGALDLRVFNVNDIEAGLERLLKDPRVGSTMSGRAWALKTLHPACEQLPGAFAIPDYVDMCTATLEWSVTATMSGTNGSTKRGTEADIILWPSPEMGLWIRRDTSTVSSMEDLHRHFANMTVNGSPFEKVEISQPTVTNFGGPTDPFRCYPFSTFGKGKVTSSAGALVHYATSYRITHLGLTVEGVANMTDDEGMIYAAQFPYEFDIKELEGSTGKKSPFYLMPFPKLDVESISTTPRAYAAKATQGCYVPVRQTRYETGLISLNDPLWGCPWTDDYTDARGSFFNPNNDKKLNEDNHVTAKPGDYNTTVVLLRGINEKCGINMRMHMGIEMVPRTDQLLRHAMERSPPNDMVAREFVSRFRHNEADAYPAADNDFGSFIRKVLGFVTPIAGIASMMPGKIGAVGKVVSSVANSVNKLI